MEYVQCAAFRWQMGASHSSSCFQKTAHENAQDGLLKCLVTLTQ